MVCFQGIDERIQGRNEQEEDLDGLRAIEPKNARDRVRSQAVATTVAQPSPMSRRLPPVMFAVAKAV